ncbi:hypothetical protein Hamer_G025013 [Homarus americanus]|uniref:Membrane dipeptidase n=1 Tax=Homarus americanus TaxID=6706 RepID=A0A8J5TDB4_HOMAM|nr:hypothetical protein Hamer_G025013 [Homarus americanus]
MVTVVRDEPSGADGRSRVSHLTSLPQTVVRDEEPLGLMVDLSHVSLTPHFSPQTVVREMNRLGLMVDLSHVSLLTSPSTVVREMNRLGLMTVVRDEPSGADVSHMCLRRAMRGAGGVKSAGHLQPLRVLYLTHQPRQEGGRRQPRRNWCRFRRYKHVGVDLQQQRVKAGGRVARSPEDEAASTASPDRLTMRE